MYSTWISSGGEFNTSIFDILLREQLEVGSVNGGFRWQFESYTRTCFFSLVWKNLRSLWKCQRTIAFSGYFIWDKYDGHCIRLFLYHYYIHYCFWNFIVCWVRNNLRKGETCQ